MIRLLICDDHPLLRSGLKLVLNAEPELDVVGEAGDGVEALAQVAALEPDLVLMDLSLPKLNGLQTTALIVEKHPASKVVFLSMHESEAYVEEALKAGAVGYVPKKAADRDLVTAIQHVHAGRLYIHPSLGYDLPDGSRAQEIRDGGTLKDLLSRRERELLKLVAEGHSNTEIAQMLDIHLRTVESYRANMMEKLGLRRRVDLVRYALNTGILLA
jgi:two-component system response regulator NreC